MVLHSGCGCQALQPRAELSQFKVIVPGGADYAKSCCAPVNPGVIPDGCLAAIASFLQNREREQIVGIQVRQTGISHKSTVVLGVFHQKLLMAKAEFNNREPREPADFSCGL